MKAALLPDRGVVKVAGIDSAGYFVATNRIPSTGKAVLYGYPGNEYSTQDCTVDDKGDLSCKVRAGGSGGPLIKGDYADLGAGSKRQPANGERSNTACRHRRSETAFRTAAQSFVR